MSIFRNDTLGSWTRGGQAIVHNLGMTTQVSFQTIAAGIVLWFTGAVWYALERSSDYERFVLVKLGEALLKASAAPGTNDPVLFKTPECLRDRTCPHLRRARHDPSAPPQWFASEHRSLLLGG